MKNLFEKVKLFFDRIDASYLELNGQQAIEFTVESPEHSWDVMISTFNEPCCVIIHSTFPQPVPTSLRAELALYLSVLNTARPIGNFELDIETGDIRFKTYIDCTATSLTANGLDRALTTNLLTMRKYLPEILSIIEREATLLDDDIELKRA